MEVLTGHILLLIKAIDIRSEPAVRLLGELLDTDEYPRGAEQFAHELYSWLRSPYKDLRRYDEIAQVSHEMRNGADDSTIKYPILGSDHRLDRAVVEVEVGVEVQVDRHPLPPAPHTPARYHLYHPDHPHATYVPSLAHGHQHDLEDGTNPIHGSTRNTKHSSSLKRNVMQKEWNYVDVDYQSVTMVMCKNKDRCDHGANPKSSFCHLHHQLHFVWTTIQSKRIIRPKLPL